MKIKCMTSNNTTHIIVYNEDDPEDGRGGGIKAILVNRPWRPVRV
jgi:hypothetical protein